MFNLYMLDEYHAVGQFVDKDGNLSWQMIHTNAPIINNEIDGDAGFELSEIDPNDFEFGGKRLRLLI